MSKCYKADQYESAFVSNHLQNYQIAKNDEKEPTSRNGFTKIIANDRGHLTGNAKRSPESPWGTFVGTWDLPVKISGPRVVNPTARSPVHQQHLLREKEEADFIINGKYKSLEDSKVDPTCNGRQPFSKNQQEEQEVLKAMNESANATGSPTIRSGAQAPTHDLMEEPPKEPSPVFDTPAVAVTGGPNPHYSHGIPHVMPDGQCDVDETAINADGVVAALNSPSTAYRTSKVNEEAEAVQEPVEK